MVIEIGVIGAGGMATDHLDNIAAHPNAEAVAVCAATESSARETADEHGIRPYTDAEELYRVERPDAAIVAIPPFAHGDAELSAAEHGVDLLVEKPLALSRETARTIHRAVEDAGLVTQVGHMLRYADVVERAVELVDDRPLALVEGRWIDAVPPLEWWSIKARSGGQVVEQATHIYDLVRYFAGDVESVSAVGGQRVVTEEIDFADSSIGTMRHENGVVSQVTATSASPTLDYGVELVGEGLRLELDFVDHVLAGVVDGERVREVGDERMYAKELDAFVEAVEADDPSGVRSPYGDALRTFELTMTVDEEIESGRV